MDSLKQDLATQIARLPVGGGSNTPSRSRVADDHVAQMELGGDLTDIKVGGGGNVPRWVCRMVLLCRVIVV